MAEPQRCAKCVACWWSMQHPFLLLCCIAGAVHFHSESGNLLRFVNKQCPRGQECEACRLLSRRYQPHNIHPKSQAAIAEAG